MAKYSVDSDRSSGQDTEETQPRNCELCGDESENLQSVSIEGAGLFVCSSCAPTDDRTETKETRDNDSPNNRQKELINEATPDADEALPDSSWAEDGLGYDENSLPYLVDDYGKVVTDGRLAQDMSQEELSEEINVGVNIVRVIEQGQAASNDVGGKIIQQLEEVLDVTLEEEA